MQRPIVQWCYVPVPQSGQRELTFLSLVKLQTQSLAAIPHGREILKYILVMCV